MEYNYLSLLKKIKTYIPKDNIITDPTLCYAYGTDASLYRITPKIVLKVRHAEEMSKFIKDALFYKTPITFRAAGTSLSGQALSDSILVVLHENYWKKITIIDNGKEVSLEPGLIGGDVNLILKPYGYKIGPDPSSINSCKIGGIAANNSSGMCCGVKLNAYHTLKGMKIIFCDGTVLDTLNKNSVDTFKQKHFDLLDSIYELRLQLLENKPLREKVQTKYRIKNTTGYGINALLDYENPIDILQHLLIGSEGTLGFIANINLETIPLKNNQMTGFFVFENIENACEAVVEITKLNPDAIELMDFLSLKSLVPISEIGFYDSHLSKGSKPAALLIQIQGDSSDSLIDKAASINKESLRHNLLFKYDFTKDENQTKNLWDLRKALLPKVGAHRERGSTLIVEDVTVPLTCLAQATIQIQNLLKKYDYTDGVIFGHAMDGSLHIVFSQQFNHQEGHKKYQNFIDELVRIIVNDFNGSLKGEHGTGRNMAPFVEQEWGKDAYSIMQKVKTLFDKTFLLNPGVIINDDPEAHLKNIKQKEIHHSDLDKCMDCGFCEKVCPSEGYTFTPRQRNTILDKIKSLDNQSNHYNTKKTHKIFQHYGVDTCATTGACELSCPVGINVGQLILTEKSKSDVLVKSKFVDLIAKNFEITTDIMRFNLSSLSFLKKLLGKEFVERKSMQINQKISSIPYVGSNFPNALKKNQLQKIAQSDNQLKQVVYIPSCINRLMGNNDSNKQESPLIEIVVKVLSYFGYNVLIPQNINELCCGLAFKSKGFLKSYHFKNDEMLSSITEMKLTSDNTPILMDHSSCFDCLIEKNKNMNIYEPFRFIDEYILDRFASSPSKDKVLVHIPCSSIKNKLHQSFYNVMNKISENIEYTELECCGFSGDKGFFYPKLNENALRKMSRDKISCDYGVSNSRTCEIGLADHTGLEFNSIFHLFNQLIESQSLKLEQVE